MSDPYTVIGTIAVGYAVSKLTEKVTGSETLGMVAGLAAGGWAGTAISGYMAASAAAPAVAGATAPGSALGVASAGAAPLGAAGAVPIGSPIAAQAAAAGPGAAAALPGAASAAAPAVAAAAPAASSGGGFLSGFDPNEVLKVAASGLSGMAASKEKEKDREVDKDYLKLREDEFEDDKRRYYAQGAYGVTNDGRVVPINAGGQLQAMNQRLGFQPHTSSGTMTNINAVPRDDGGYLASFGRFGGTNA